MCLINFAYKIDPVYRLILSANRDEFYKRSTAQAAFWEDVPSILAGRDLEKMGTWMGVTKNGRFAALTNYRSSAIDKKQLRSRGELVSRFLQFNENPKDYLDKIQKNREYYPGFNLLVGDQAALYYYSNVENQIKLLEPGLYGLSNSLLDTPWPKVRKGKKGLQTCLNNARENLTECLFSSLQYEEPAADSELPSTGVSIEWERKLSPLFIKTPEYGTRSSTVLFMKSEEVKFVERTYIGDEVKEKNFEFRIEMK
ncbi:NRDE family protein [Metabacillus litoralis]|uniref:NRDE family protein n=1 Tax=Metabacillus litoralis TaxID=152268 RepID=UPI000EF566CE|nr:NRDE family protein [Metabacillus litoralis]